MSADVLKRYAVGGAMRPDSFSGFQPQFTSALANMFTSAPPEIQNQLRISSGYRSPEVQAQLYKAALAKYGSPEAARKWVAPPGHSQHNHGHAADLKYLAPAAMKWAHENAGRFGLAFPLKNENWHVELASARGQQPAPTQNPPAPVVAAAPQAGTSPTAMSSAPLSGSGGTMPFASPSLGDLFAPALAQMSQALSSPQEQANARRQRLAAMFG